MEFNIESYDDMHDMVEQMIMLLGDRESCTFVDDDCNTWEVKQVIDGTYLAACLSKNSLLKIKRESI